MMRWLNGAVGTSMEWISSVCVVPLGVDRGNSADDYCNNCSMSSTRSMMMKQPNNDPMKMLQAFFISRSRVFSSAFFSFGFAVNNKNERTIIKADQK